MILWALHYNCYWEKKAICISLIISIISAVEMRSLPLPSPSYGRSYGALGSLISLMLMPVSWWPCCLSKSQDTQLRAYPIDSSLTSEPAFELTNSWNNWKNCCALTHSSRETRVAIKSAELCGQTGLLPLYLSCLVTDLRFISLLNLFLENLAGRVDCVCVCGGT